jgi:hypothetical protein
LRQTLKERVKAKGESMKSIRIFRDSNHEVKFEEVAVLNTDNVFFINDDNVTHWPTICADKVEPSEASSECPAPDQPYRCRIDGHEEEVGTIEKVKPLARGNPELQQATSGQQITEQQVVSGGKSPYITSEASFEVRDSTGATIDSGSGIGPGLHLIPKMNNNGVFVGGTPVLSGTYFFVFTVDDKIEQNLGQIRYSMKVV